MLSRIKFSANLNCSFCYFELYFQYNVTYDYFSKKKTKDSFGMLTFIDIGTPLRNNSNVLAWSWLQVSTRRHGNTHVTVKHSRDHNHALPFLGRYSSDGGQIH